MKYSPLSRLFALALLLLTAGLATHARAYVNQSDGTVVPVTTRMQQCLDRPVSGDGAGVIDAIADAAIIPEAYRPVLDTASGHYRGTFVDIGEGAGFRNSFGWYWVGTDVSDPANLFTIFGCRTYGTCNCPCATTRTVTVDFDTMPGFTAGRPIGFWLRTPERLDASREDGAYDTGLGYCTANVGCNPNIANLNDSCGGRLDSNNRIYFTSAALNDDGDFVHFLVYESVTFADTYYFGFEDLFRGGDNDYEDMLVRGTGLVPECDPRPETCNNADDDCDARVDELLTMSCSTACGTGTRTCTAGSFGACSARTPTTESCNNINDDCDASTDEGLSRACSNMCGAGTEICIAGTFAGCTAPTPTLESCNNRDDDCDSLTDEDLTRTCATACGAGTQTCTAGTFGACSARLPTPIELCDAIDQDCDARVDENLTRDCSNACGSGIEVCRGGVYGDCDAPPAGVEACNAIDDDCDGMVDEMLTRACSTACGVGTETCTAGSFAGCDAPLPSVEECNNRDDDCDGVIDDGNPGGGAACLPFADGGFGPGGDFDAGAGDDGGVVCGNGVVRCIAGALTCGGATTTSREVCNCLDDDCDGNIDEETAEDPLCPGGACIASECACREPCMATEFPCPNGTICDESLAMPPDITGYCVEGACNGVTCGSDEEVCNPDTGVCENLCTGVSCTAGFVCVRGGCAEDNCFGRGCPTPGELCVLDAGGTPTCEANPCTGVTCGDGQFCRDGECESVCLEGCPHGTVCSDGACVDDGCGGCPLGQSCVAGTCEVDTCSPFCGRLRECVGGSCVSDRCTGVMCPSGTSCFEGTCQGGTPADPPRRGLAQGGACSCDAAGAGPRGAVPAMLGLALLGLLLVRRRLMALAPVAVVALAVTSTGCAVEPYCFENCGDDLVDGGDASTVDAARDAPPSNTDGCIVTGPTEVCDALDNDCNGFTDEGFDLEGDPRNCGSCGNECNVPNAYPACTAGECDIDRCAIGYTDLDGVVSNGCEYRCLAVGAEICDGLDDDCDGEIDDGFDLDTDEGNCGRCGNVCAIPNATSSCTGGVCVGTGCRAGYVDLDGDDSNGCEYNCTATGTETCNGVDDDCNRAIDEGFDLMSDEANCGACGRACAFMNAMASCTSGVCGFNPLTDCLPGFVDADGDARTGCEYACTRTGGIDDCDGTDEDCDGRIDESDPMVGTACGVSTGSCDPGVRACVVGVITCLGGTSPLTELCNGADDNCNGSTDELPLPGVGDRCGATDVGRCAYGTTVCTAGGISCSGEITAIAETCNGVDDNCNGATDDGVPVPSAASVPSCAETRGVCAGRVPTCRGAAGFGCDLPATYQAVETRCDTLDNDCDGTADENCLRPSGATDIRIDTGDTATSANSLDPFILGDGGARVWVGWTDMRVVADPVRAHAFFNRSTDTGANWLGTAVQLSTAGGGTFPLQLGFSNTDDVVAVWPDFRGGTGYREIYSAYATSYGATFAANLKVNATGTSSTRDSYNVDVATSGSNVYVAYESFATTRQRQIWFARSTDGGASWNAPVQLSTGTGTSFVASTPRIAAAGSNVYVVWRDNRSGSLDLQLRRSTNSGSTFSAEQRIDTGDTAGSNSSFSPEIAAEGANVYVAWVDDRVGGSFDIHFNDSNDSGATWRASALSLDGDAFPHDSIEPHVVAPAAGVVMVSWLDYRSGFPDPMVIRSSNSGSTFGTPERLDTATSPGASGSYDLAFGARGSLIAAAWADDRNGLLDVYANFSLDGGVTWQPQDYRLDTGTAGVADSQRPTIFVGTSAFHVAWEEHRRGAGCTTGAAGDPECPAADIHYRAVR